MIILVFSLAFLKYWAIQAKGRRSCRDELSEGASDADILEVREIEE